MKKQKQPKRCPDQCGMRRDRWVEKPTGSKDRKQVICGKCGRFIGYTKG